MSKTTSRIPRDLSGRITDILTRNPDGLTSRKLAALTGFLPKDVNDTLTDMEANGAVTRVLGQVGANGRQGADTWRLATPTAADPAPSTDPTEGDQDTDDQVLDDTAEDFEDTDGDSAPTGGSVTTPATPGPDFFKIVMVATVLEGHPRGITAADLVDRSGLRAQIVTRVLGAMEVVGAAVRRPANDDGEIETWSRGATDLTAVDLSNVAVREVCPHCHRPMPRRANPVQIRRAAGPTTLGQNSDGQPKLRKGELRTMVLEFIEAHPGHDFTARDLSHELRRSSGAIENNLSHLLSQGLIKHANDGDPNTRKVTALATTD